MSSAQIYFPCSGQEMPLYTGVYNLKHTTN